METKDLMNLSHEELRELYQKDDITLCQLLQTSPEYKNEYLEFCENESRHKDDNEAAIAFLDYSVKMLEEEIKNHNI